MMSRNSDILYTTEYIKNVLYFATVRPGKVLQSTSNLHYFCIDDELLYMNYYSDFGPLNLGCVYKYCRILSEKLQQYSDKQTVVHYTSAECRKKTNSAFLMGCYGVLFLNLSPRDALKPLLLHGQTYKPFQDATQGDSSYTINILDCLFAIRKAHSMDFFNFKDFNYEEYERLDKIEGGDLNWIVPGKFLAFIGPVDYSISLYHPPEMYVDYFRENNVKIVIRLNKRMYNANVFTDAGLTHYDLFFPDGSCPPRHILTKFLQISEQSTGAIAVHCKAGLGRTGSLIGCYLIKHYRMSAHEAIGWMRICRPGSVIGHQQGWLEHLEPWLIKQGYLYRKRKYQDAEKFPVHEYGLYSISEKIMRQHPLTFGKSPSILSQTQRLSRSSRLDTAPVKTPDSKTQPETSLSYTQEEIDAAFYVTIDMVNKAREMLIKLLDKAFQPSPIEAVDEERPQLEQSPSCRRDLSRWKVLRVNCCEVYNIWSWKLAVFCARMTPVKLNSCMCCMFWDWVSNLTSKTCRTDKYNWSSMMKSKTSNINNAKPSVIKGPNHLRNIDEVLSKPKGLKRNSGAGGGEPRIAPRSPSRSRRTDDWTMNAFDMNKITIPTFRTSQGPICKTLSEAKNYLMKSSLNAQEREMALISSLAVTPMRLVGNNNQTTFAAVFSHVNCGPPPGPRRRLPLGRSPSPSPATSPVRPSSPVRNYGAARNPSPSRNIMDQSRATNTAPLKKLWSKDIKDELLGLRCNFQEFLLPF